MFGHRRGAFTGAVESVTGHFERAHMGTLFLDEVIHLSLSAQVKLLRALETGEVQPLGSGAKRSVDFRIVSAAQEDTLGRLDQGTFRHDLMQRLAGIVIDLPMLADRPEDIAPLAEHFAAAQGRRLGSDATRVLERYSWPGNVRELRLAIERAGCLVMNGTLSSGAVRDAIALGIPRIQRTDWPNAERRRPRLDRDSDDLIARCAANRWDAGRVAESLGIARSTLYERLKAAGISLRTLRQGGSRSPQGFHAHSVEVPEDFRRQATPT
jgi:DNA-binding NtrC family response regulator